MDEAVYAERLATLKAAKKEVESLIASMPDGQNKRMLQTDWRRVIICNIPESTVIAMNDPTPGPAISIDGRNWQHADLIAPALKAYHLAVREVMLAFTDLRVRGKNPDPPAL